MANTPQALSVEEVRNDPAARAEAERRTGDLSDEFVAQQIEAFKQEADDVTRDERQAQRDLFDLWEGRRDFSKKEPWQNKVVVEKPFTAVEQATAQIERALLDSPNYMQITGTDPANGAPVSVWADYIKYALDVSRFAPKFIDAVQMAFVTNVSGYLKPRWLSYTITLPDGKRVSASFLQLTIIPPWRIFRDPDSTPREPWSGTFVIDSEWTDIATLRASPVTIKENIDKIASGGGGQQISSTVDPEDKTRVKEWKRSKFRKALVVDEFWGDLRNENGDIILPDALAAKTGNVLVRKAATMPIWSVEPTNGRRRWPLVAFSPFTHPLRFEGRGILQQSWRVAKFYENIFNISGDALAFSIFSGLQGDMTRLVNPTDTAIRPAKFWGLKAGASSDVLKIVESGRIDMSAVLAYLQHIDQVHQNSSFVSDFVIGLPGYRSDITKGEVQLKTAQSLSIFDRMAKAIELGGQQTVELIYDMLVQYTDVSTIAVIGNSLPPEWVEKITMATPIERWTQMRADMQIRFVGISQALQRDQQLARGMQLLGIIKDPSFFPLVENPQDFLKDLIDFSGFRDKIKVRAPMPIQPTALGGTPEVPGTEAPRPPTIASIARRVGMALPQGTIDQNGGVGA